MIRRCSIRQRASFPNRRTGRAARRRATGRIRTTGRRRHRESWQDDRSVRCPCQDCTRFRDRAGRFWCVSCPLFLVRLSGATIFVFSGDEIRLLLMLRPLTGVAVAASTTQHGATAVASRSRISRTSPFSRRSVCVVTGGILLDLALLDLSGLEQVAQCGSKRVHVATDPP